MGYKLDYRYSLWSSFVAYNRLANPIHMHSMTGILPENDSQLVSRLQTTSVWFARLVLLTACLNLVGWQFDIEFFKRPIPHLVAMNPLTAVCFIASSSSLLLYNSHRYVRLGQLVALLPLLVGVLMLIKRTTGYGPNLQALLFSQAIKADAVGNLSNLMAINTSSCFLLLGAALSYMHAYRGIESLLSQRLAFLIGIIALISLLGYAYQVQAFYGALASYPMAIHTALAFFLLALGLIFATANQGFIKHICNHLAGGMLGRSFAGVALLVPFVVGLALMKGYWMGLFTPEMAMALLVGSLTIIFLGLLWRNVLVLNQKDAQQLSAQESLRQQEEQLQTLFRAAPDAILVFDTQGRIVTWNARAIQLLGFPESSSLADKSIESLMTKRSLETLEREKQALTTTDTQATNHSFDVTILTTSQAEIETAFSVSKTVIQGKQLFISFLRDVTQQRLATQQLKQANSDLVRSNDNLQQFAYVASHDLQEPLRKVQSFGDLLHSQYEVELGEGIAYLERMQSAASRMSTLIKDLLTFSRIATRQDDTASVSLNRVVNTTLTDLELIIQDTGAVVSVASLPTIQGDSTQLEQLFQNLVSNALKFRRSDTLPTVRIDSYAVAAADLPLSVKPSRLSAMYDRIDIADNGIGFDEKYLDRIFQVFQRLHGKNQYAGTGIGLAICEKVAANHGGAITATSLPGEGATFSVYLPR
jgi:PAS domain S-box-containing protein